MSLDSAKIHIANGRINDAINVLDSAVTIATVKTRVQKDPQELFDLLDARSLCYAKIKQFNRSKEDANHMIKLVPVDGRGYIRKAQVYYQNGHFKRAAQVYRDALKNLEADSQWRPKIIKQQKDIILMSKTKFVDPFERLPAEIIVLILNKCLTTWRSIMPFMLVSKRWHQFIASESTFWSNLKFDGKSVDSATVQRLCSRSGVRALKVHIACTIRRGDKLARAFQQMEYMNTLRFDTADITADQLRKCRFVYLESLRIASVNVEADLVWALESLENLKFLELFQVQKTKEPKLARVQVKAPLEGLTIIGNSATGCLQPSLVQSILDQRALSVFQLHHVLTTLDVTEPLYASNTLRSFGFTTCGTRATAPTFSQHFASPLENLTLNKVVVRVSEGQVPLPLSYLEVKWSTANTLSVAGLLNHFKCYETIQTLVLQESVIQGFLETDSSEIYPYLRTLHLVAMPVSIDSNFLGWIEKSLPQLTSLNANDTPMDGRAVARLVKHGVKVLRCRGAHSIATDTIVWARSLGVKIYFN